jgi:AcrR family transcriptional regulator
MARDAEATRRRLLEAAAAEFAELGIAGARVDRIAVAARTNKAQIYHYFGSKEGLFEAVLAGILHDVLASDPFDADDLPGSMGRIFDQFEDDPLLARLATWYRLERSGDAPNAAIVAANTAKVAAIRAAQREGRVTDAFPADVLLGLLISIATAWASLPPEYTPSARNNTRPKRRAAVVEAARRLVAP